MTLFEKSKSTKLTWEWTKKMNVFSISQTIMAGPIPVKLSAGLGMGFQVGLAIGGAQAGVNGFARAWAYGYASAGVSLFIVGVDLRVTLNLFNTRLDCDVDIVPMASDKADLVSKVIESMKESKSLGEWLIKALLLSALGAEQVDALNVKATLSVEPISIVVELVVWVDVLFWSDEWTLELVNWSAGKYTVPLFEF
jgi:hypothetical protein